MPRNDRVETVRFTGGQHHGLIVQAPAHIAERLHAMTFEVLATGQLYDTAQQRRIPNTRAVNPSPQPDPVATPAVAKPAAARAVAAPAVAAVKPSAPAPLPDFSPPPAPSGRSPRPAPPGMPVFQPARPS